MATIQMTVKGMSCSGCANSITRRLNSTPGVQSASVDLDSGIANITFDDTETDANSLEKVIESLGFDVIYSMGREE
ncbi:MAG: heavy-metal-associated domain-containing protein [Armatimonadota bacterium]